MYKNKSFLLTVILLSFVLFSSFLFSGCKSTQKTDNLTDVTTTVDTAVTNADDNALGDSDSGKAGGLQTVHFGYDSFILDESSKAVLDTNADILKTKSTLRVQVEGHCDQRGGIQYNLGLGEKRASIVKKYLLDKGIAADRIATISYGKEKLLDTTDTETAYTKNRRANFAITSK
jgi:peptidoglycan-associated lipoprotein